MVEKAEDAFDESTSQEVGDDVPIWHGEVN